MLSREHSEASCGEIFRCAQDGRAGELREDC